MDRQIVDPTPLVPFYQSPTIILYYADSLRIRARENWVDAIVTDPPYGLEFMGKQWDAPWKTDRRQTFDGTLTDTRPNPYGRSKVRNGNGASYGADARAMQALQDWYYEWAVRMLQTLKPGGHLLAFGGSRTYHRLACAIEDAGFEIRDQIMWVYGSGFPKSHNLAGEWQGWGTALKPAHEPIVVARKPLQGTVTANVLKWGTGAVNVDGCRIDAIRLAQTYSQPDIRGNAYNAERDKRHMAEVAENLGRWPANLIHDGSDEVLACFPLAPGQLADASSTAPSSRTKNCFGKMSREGEASADRRYTEEGSTNFAALPGQRRLDSGSAARFFYCAKTSKSERGEGNNHPTVKPQALMRYLCRLVTPPGGIVLDPFCGSGSTGLAALAEGFRFVGIEQKEEYCRIAADRLTAKEVVNVG